MFVFVADYFFFVFFGGVLVDTEIDNMIILSCHQGKLLNEKAEYNDIDSKYGAL